MHVLCLNDPLHSRNPDSQYAEEVDEVRSVGFQVSLFSFEEFQSGVFQPRPALPAGSKVIYRGWMISAVEYQNLEAAALQLGSKQMVDTDMYLASHYLPNWYKLISYLLQRRTSSQQAATRKMPF